MKIRMLRSETGREHSFALGEVVEWLPDHVALKMVRQGRAELVGAPVAYESAVRRPVESRSPFEGFLDRPVREIQADLPSQSVEALKQLLLSEQRGKARRSLVPMIEEEIRSR